jgi:hypothetical protein
MGKGDGSAKKGTVPFFNKKIKEKLVKGTVPFTNFP